MLIGAHQREREREEEEGRGDKKGEERKKLPGVYGSPDHKAAFARSLRVAEITDEGDRA